MALTSDGKLCARDQVRQSHLSCLAFGANPKSIIVGAMSSLLSSVCKTYSVPLVQQPHPHKSRLIDDSSCTQIDPYHVSKHLFPFGREYQKPFRISSVAFVPETVPGRVVIVNTGEGKRDTLSPPPPIPLQSEIWTSWLQTAT